MFCIERLLSLWHLEQGMPKNPPAEQPPHATHPPDERPHSVSTPSPDDTARWLQLADIALSEERIAEIEALARKEQAAIKKRIRRTVQQVRGQSKTKQ